MAQHTGGNPTGWGQKVDARVDQFVDACVVAVRFEFFLELGGEQRLDVVDRRACALALVELVAQPAAHSNAYIHFDRTFLDDLPLRADPYTCNRPTK